MKKLDTRQARKDAATAKAIFQMVPMKDATMQWFMDQTEMLEDALSMSQAQKRYTASGRDPDARESADTARVAVLKSTLSLRLRAHKAKKVEAKLVQDLAAAAGPAESQDATSETQFAAAVDMEEALKESVSEWVSLHASAPMDSIRQALQHIAQKQLDECQGFLAEAQALLDCAGGDAKQWKSALFEDTMAEACKAFQHVDGSKLREKIQVFEEACWQPLSSTYLESLDSQVL